MRKKLIYIIGSIFLVGVAFIIVGIITSQGIKVNYHTIDKTFDLNLAHFTDTHFDDDFQRDKYIKLVVTLNESETDVLMFTGDLFQVSNISEELESSVISLLSELKATHKIAVLGNHDYFHGTAFEETVISILESSGFTVLVNEKVELEINDTSLLFFMVNL